MNKAKLKSYAPQARKDFIAAVTARANLLGLADKAGKLEVAASQPQGDVTVIAGQAWPVKVHSQRQQLITRIQKDGFTQTMEAMAYTWFNRFAALRYMELHDYLGHGHRALSSSEGTLPDILTHAADLAQSGELPGLKPALMADMKLAGNRDGDLYRMLLVAQCNALSNAMPFLFERIDDETELLLPENLLRTDSVIAKLVATIDEEDWKEVEIIGWLYQFYISEKKDEVIGKVVKSEDIPAATQLFTPNWIVQYLVQNSVGRLWLLANPASTLKPQWPYFIEPAQQTSEVQVQLDALIQTRVNEDGGSLNPESITLLDPACGSGHILVEAYGLLKAIYLERGYQPRAIPRLILEKNLFGLDIDDRAVQMAGFALLMKARADDRRLFDGPIKLNVLALQESKGLNADVLTRSLQTALIRGNLQTDTSASAGGFSDDNVFSSSHPQNSPGKAIVADMVDEPAQQAIAVLIDIFTHAKTFGSLIQIPQALNAQLATLTKRLQHALQTGDLYTQAAAQDLLPLLAQARVLGMQFDSVVANPPYMGAKNMSPLIKNYISENFQDFKADIFSAFIARCLSLAKPNAPLSFVCPYLWMFIGSYEELRKLVFSKAHLTSLVQLEYNAFEPACIPISIFSIVNAPTPNYVGGYIRLTQFKGHESQAPRTREAIADENCGWFYRANQKSFSQIPGNCIAFWIGQALHNVYSNGVPLGSIAAPRQGLATADNGRFLRRWFEVSVKNIAFSCSNKEEALLTGSKWFPHNKGGNFRRWYGNNEYIINWKDGGIEIRAYDKSVIRNPDYYFLEGITWSDLTSSLFAGRKVTNGFIFDTTGPTMFPTSGFNTNHLLAYVNSKVFQELVNVSLQGMHYSNGVIADTPIIPSEMVTQVVEPIVEELVDISRLDWDSREISWDFQRHPFVKPSPESTSLKQVWLDWLSYSTRQFTRTHVLESENNLVFIDAYSLSREVSPDIPESQITLTRADREKDFQRLISYIIGCMMGRYSLDAPGLIYASAGNIGFDVSRYSTFPADADGIVPITDELWFEDDAASRIREFVLAVWSADTLAENMGWLAESLGSKASETPNETIRRYLADKFYKDHLQTYKKRPIYWLFSSGKHGAFQALVYLHRYHEGTLARLRAEYVVPLTSKIQSRIDMLENDVATVSSTAARNKLAKEVEKLKKKHVELLAYDEQLRHYADMRVSLDLDDGVKVNYGKFGDLLAEAKAVTGGARDE